MKNYNNIFFFFVSTTPLFFTTVYSEPPTEFEKISFFNAVGAGDLKKVKELFKKNELLISQKNHLKETPLLVSLKKGFEKIISFLLKKESPVNEQDKEGHSALHLAILNNNSKLSADLIARGADVNLLSKEGYAPLHYASWIGNIGLVLLLLSEEKININAATKEGITPIMLAHIQSHTDVVRQLLKKGASIVA